jgi:hypothetical protein
VQYRKDEGAEVDPGHAGSRGCLRTVGPLVLGVGVVLTAIGFISFSSAFGGSGMPRYFWCAFIGLPMTGIGGAITKFAYMGRIGRYVAGEMAPVAKDTFNYVAKGAAPGVKDIARAVGEGLAAGGAAGGAGGAAASGEGRTLVRCHKCNKENDDKAKFCDECGTALAKTKPCPSCGEKNDPDARFCDECGKRFD